jgi:hypothetical protein
MRYLPVIILLVLFHLSSSAQQDSAGYFLKKASEQGKAAIRYEVAAIIMLSAAPLPAYITARSGNPNYTGTILLTGAAIGFGIASIVSHAAAWNSINDAGDKLRIGILPSGRLGIACRL